MRILQKQVDEIMDNFNFSRVRTTMKALNWIWASSEEEDKIPSEPELRKTARKLLYDAVGSPLRYYSASTGGFRATKEDDYIELEFVIENWYDEID